MSKRITIEELQSYLWNSAVLLRTNIDAGAYKQYIFPLLFFKRICDVYDEETALAIEEYGDDAAEFDADEIHTFVVPKGYHWNDVRAVSENVGVAIVEAFRKVENANIDKLQGIFGDGAWTNKNRLPDRLLKDLLEHFSTRTLSIANCPEDELGQGYEYLIKKFADDSGHTAQEFYTNRTVVHLMTEMLKPESGESIYDPTCGSAGICLAEDCGAYGAGEHTSYIVSGKCWVNNHAHVLIPKECCDIEFANIYFRILDMTEYVTGTTRLKLTQAKMKTLPMILPSLELQREFAAFVRQSDKSKLLISRLEEFTLMDYRGHGKM